MAFRSIATLSLSFGLVSIPVKVYSATESSAAVRFKLLSRGGQRVRRQYVAGEDEPSVLEDEDEDEAAPAPVSSPAAPARPASSPTAAAAASRPSGTGAASQPWATGRAASQPPPSMATSSPEREPPSIEAAPSPRHDAGLTSSEMVKGYEFERGRFVTFTAAELKALAEASRPTIDIVAFIPEGSVDPVYYDKAYYLAPDKPGSKPYGLLHAAMQASGRCAVAKWAWRAKEYVVQIRPAGAGLVLQQLLYADEVRSIDDLGIELADVGDAELQLALRLIEQISADSYDPHQFVDEEKQRILAAVERKIAGRKVVAEPAHPAPSAQVIDLVAALKASLGAIQPPPGRAGVRNEPAAAARERKPARRAAKKAPTAEGPSAPAPAAGRARGRQSAR